MSVTFYVEDWHKQEQITKKVFLSDLFDDNDESWFAMLKEGDSLIHFDEESQKHFEYRDEYKDAFPELNMANDRAKTIIDLLGLDYDPSEGLVGDIKLEDIPTVIRSAVMVLNSRSRVESGTRTQSVTMRVDKENAILTPRFIECAITDEYIIERINELVDILKFAQSKKKSVYWA